jgi:glycosyltransferase involved in cell wall biosynthesis
VRVLLIAFYFPPAGGGGVQRTLKFCRHLPAEGVEVHVLAPDDPKWFARDEALAAEVPAGTRVHRARFVGPQATFRQAALAGRRGLALAAAHVRYGASRALVPDKAAPWLLTAVPAGARILRRERIDAVVTTSPPNSVHLVGALVAAATGVPWVADFRDSWLANPHRRYEHPGVRAKRALEVRLARLVARRACAITAVTPAIAAEIAALHPAAPAKTTVISNGVDFDDFDALPHRPGDRFTIVHTGFFFGLRTPRPFLRALARLLARRPELRRRVLARFVGDLRASDRDWAAGLGIDGAWEETGFLPYRRTVAAQREADALLLLIPHADGRGDAVLSGKVFEYLAARRPVLAAVPPGGVAADLVRETGAGEVVDGDDEDAIEAALERLVDRWADGGLPDREVPPAVRDRVSRRARAGELAAVLRSVTAARS